MDTIWSYIEQHLEPTKNREFFNVKKDIKVFKTVEDPLCKKLLIVNLIIPTGAEIYIRWLTQAEFNDIPLFEYEERILANVRCHYFLKARASKAIVHSIVDKHSKRQMKVGYSIFNEYFEYRVGATVKPRDRFSRSSQTCDSGIHFFFTLEEAMNY